MNSPPAAGSIAPPKELRRLALHWLAETDPKRKSAGVAEMFSAWQQGELSLEADAALTCDHALPGRPLVPQLVPPREVGRRSMRTVEGRAAMIHALTHIEFNAVNLALDAIWRFAGMPHEYHADWLKVAAEEAFHFSLLSAHLQTLGFSYGDFAAHNGLWDMAEKTRHDILARISLVPRTLEARGLDASPLMRAKLAQAGDEAAAGILDIILRDEIGHVATGNKWFHRLCIQRGLEPMATYTELARLHDAPVLRGPFNIEARRAAGFSDAEMAFLFQ